MLKYTQIIYFVVWFIFTVLVCSVLEVEVGYCAGIASFLLLVYLPYFAFRSGYNERKREDSHNQ